jgi:hypothetical protein
MFLRWQDVLHCERRVILVEVRRIERPVPFDVLFVPRMFGIDDGFHKVVVSVDTTNVFRVGVNSVIGWLCFLFNKDDFAVT